MFPQFGHAGEAEDPYLVAVGFGYHAKPSTDERDSGTASLVRGRQDPSRDPDSAGANDPRNRGGTLRGNVHPTVKPISAMRWLCRLVCRRGGTVLDPFLGSGTTGIAALQEDMHFIGIEREPEYFAIAQARIKWWAGRHQLSMF
jgi:site-specific DNA-methyltransferase (adenine-specific)